ncbi:MAG: nucleotidyltransferase family protein [Peptococcaceae bacterium]|jgi:predicted nucleotidyltransferase|nr:nucleotidyltransferase family protein [Peptococcaceae bacterium]
MKIAGIIAEYNPFHLGHAYQIQALRERHGIDAVICAMSGHFMQRGEPAMIHKRTRTRMALEQGADLVIELPALYATRSAWWFAFGGVSLLHRTGIVTHLAFGAERDALPQLRDAARVLAAEPPAFRAALSHALNDGVSFARAQSQALKHIRPDLPPVIRPNERLALNYLQIIESFSLPLTPVLIPRQGGGYHDPLPDAPGAPGAAGIPGASAIRRHLQSAPGYEEGLDQLRPFLPASSLRLLKEVLDQKKSFVFADDMAPILMALLKRASAADLAELPDMEPGLANRICATARGSHDIASFLDALKTKRYSRSRLQRLLTFLFLNYTQETAQFIGEGPPYLRILGFNSAGRQLLRQISRRGALPLITQGRQAKSLAWNHPAVKAAWSLDVRAGDLYALLEKAPSHPAGSAEYYETPCRLV